MAGVLRTGRETRGVAGTRLVAAAVVAAVVVAAPMAVVTSAAAQTHRPEASYEAAFENDAFMYFIPRMRVSDREYTNGVWLATERNDAPLWGALMGETADCAGAETKDQQCLQSRFELGQKIYTPFISDDPPPTQRPYAGWLYMAMTARVAGDMAARSLRVELGATGPPSLAEETQTVIHAITRMPPPRGWEHQLPFEPGIVLRYEESRVLERRNAMGHRLADMVLAANASVGNVLTGIQGSAVLRAGYRLPHPWLRSPPANQVSIWASAGYRRQYVARDLFLDGGTFHDETSSVERIPTTGVWTLGVAAIVRDMRLGFTYTAEDRLYETQPFPHRYSAISITVRP